MSFRGSLKQVIGFICSNAYVRNQNVITVIHVPRGKYYYLVDESSLNDTEKALNDGSQTILFSGSFRELRQFIIHDQLQMFPSDDAIH